MGNKLNRVLILLFVISALLLMIGSVSANAVELNDNLEASLDFNDGLSIDDSSNLDNKGSNQITISNVDQETDTSQGVNENLKSNDVVSDIVDSTIYTEDSDNNIKADNGPNGPQFEIQDIPLNSSAYVGDDVYFQIIGRNTGSDYYIDVIPIVFQYSKEEYDFIELIPGQNHAAPEGYNHEGRFLGPSDIGQDGWNHDQQLIGYNTSYMGSNIFYRNNYFNFTVHLKAKKAGQFLGNRVVINVNGVDYDAINGINILEKPQEIPPELMLDIISVTPISNVGDTVAFEIFGRNIGGPIMEQYLPIHIQYDEKEMHCIGYAVGVNPDVPNIDFSGNYQVNPGHDGTYDHITVLYDCGGKFDTGHCFNFTLFFKVINDDNPNPGCHAYMFWEEDWRAEAINTTKLSPESNLDLLLTQTNHEVILGDIVGLAGDVKVRFTKTAIQQFVNPGDAVDFVVYLENIGELSIPFNNRVITLYDWYPTDGFRYEGATVNETSTYASGISVEPRYDGHVQIIQHLPDTKFNPGDFLNVTLHFTALKNGILCNHMFLDEITEEKHITGSVVSGEPDLNLTKTVQEPEVDLNDYVYFDIFVKNTGDIRYYDHTTGKYKLIIQDFYPEGLEFVELMDGYKISNGHINITAEKISDGVLNITYTFEKDGTPYDYARFFQPNDSINFTLKFKAVKEGVWTNKANVYWMFKDWEPFKEMDLWDNDTVYVGKPEFALEKISNFESAKVGDTVSFSIIYTNTGLKTLTGVYIIDNEYTQGLVYSDYSDKDLWTFDGKDTWHYNGVLKPGESACLELFFKATSTGQKYNTAVAGNNELDYTLNSTDTVLIIDNDTDSSDINDDDEEDIPEDDVPSEDTKVPSVAKSASLPKVGNPLAVLIICLLTLCFVPLRGKK